MVTEDNAVKRYFSWTCTNALVPLYLLILVETTGSSVADPGCLSRIRIFHPGSRIYRSKSSVADPDPRSGAF
jgi:hypothetical protein